MRFKVFTRPAQDTLPAATDGLYEQIGLLFSSLSLRKLPAVAAAFLVVGGGGFAFVEAASDALPGDSLYAVKIHVIEHPYLNLRFATSAMADWEEERADRRLEEAELLALEGRLTEEAREALSAQYAAHSARAHSYAKRTSVVPDFETSMQGREAVLRGLVEERGEADVQLRVLLDRLQQAKRVTKTAVPVAAETQVQNNAASSIAQLDDEQESRRQLDAAHRRIEQVRIYLNDVTDELNPAASDSALHLMTQATNTLAQANARFDAGSFAEAGAMARRASLLAQEAKLVARADAELEVDLTEDISE